MKGELSSKDVSFDLMCKKEMRFLFEKLLSPLNNVVIP